MERTWKQAVLSDRDQAMLVTLCRCVKVFSVRQIARTWWAEAGSPLRRLARLEASGWIHRTRIMAREEPCTQNALALWEPGVPVPAWAAIANAARNRWTHPLRSLSTVSITAKAAEQFGGRARYPRPSEATHDLYVSEVFLQKMTVRPMEASLWVGEGRMISFCSQTNPDCVPDAILDQLSRRVAIEIVGESYTVARLKSLHEFCASRKWGYELW